MQLHLQLIHLQLTLSLLAFQLFAGKIRKTSILCTFADLKLDCASESSFCNPTFGGSLTLVGGGGGGAAGGILLLGGGGAASEFSAEVEGDKEEDELLFEELGDETELEKLTSIGEVVPCCKRSKSLSFSC